MNLIKRTIKYFLGIGDKPAQQRIDHYRNTPAREPRPIKFQAQDPTKSITDKVQSPKPYSAPTLGDLNDRLSGLMNDFKAYESQCRQLSIEAIINNDKIMIPNTQSKHKRFNYETFLNELMIINDDLRYHPDNRDYNSPKKRVIARADNFKDKVKQSRENMLCKIEGYTLTLPLRHFDKHTFEEKRLKNPGCVKECEFKEITIPLYHKGVAENINGFRSKLDAVLKYGRKLDERANIRIQNVVNSALYTYIEGTRCPAMRDNGELIYQIAPNGWNKDIKYRDSGLPSLRKKVTEWADRSDSGKKMFGQALLDTEAALSSFQYYPGSKHVADLLNYSKERRTGLKQ